MRPETKALVARRSVLLGLGSMIVARGTAQDISPPRISRPEDFGARGNGVDDDTVAIQLCLSQAPPGAIVRLRRDACYRIDTNARPTFLSFGGLKLKEGQILELNGAELRALPSRAEGGCVLQAFRVDRWRVVGPGRITGERDVHLGRTGEWGMGIAAWSAADWTIADDVEIGNCWGDGIYVGNSPNGGFCERFLIDRARVHTCRRNGISIVAGRDGLIRSADISRIGGTAPAGGIDLEPDDPARPNRAIRIDGGRISDTEVGIYVAGANQNVRISRMNIEGRNSGIIIGNHVLGLVIEDNERIASLVGNAEGAAIRTVADPTLVHDVSIRRNRLSGGGYFVVDLIGRGFDRLRMTGNELRASNPRTQGIIRMGDGVFTDNRCIIEAAAGKAGDYFIQLNHATYGRNVYRNLSRNRMYAAIFGGRDLGGDRYESPLLWKIVDRD